MGIETSNLCRSLLTGPRYVRKVFLGGTLACAAGFYILKVLLGASAESALTAVPTFITIVLLLIRSM